MLKVQISIETDERLQIELYKDSVNVGYIDLSLGYLSDIVSPELYKPHEACVIHIIINQDHRRNGYGTWLIRYATDELIKRKYKILHVEDVTANDFYQKLGFHCYSITELETPIRQMELKKSNTI